MRVIFFVIATVFSNLSWSSVSVGDTPPPLVGKTKGGDVVNLEDYKGKVVALSFWATWCPYCLKEMPVLAEVQMKLGKEQFQVIAVNYKESRRVFKSIEKKTRDFGLVMAHDRKGKYGEAYNVGGLPLLYLIDHNGKVAYRHKGYGDKTLNRIIDQIAYLVDTRNTELATKVSE